MVQPGVLFVLFVIAVAAAEAAVGLDAGSAAAEHHGIGGRELAGAVGEVDGLGGTAGGHIFGVEVENDVLFALERSQLDRFPVLVFG